MDVFADPADHEAKGALIAAILDSFREAGVARAQAFSLNAALQEDLARRGFARRTSPMQFCVRARVPSEGVFEDVGRWHVVFGDSAWTMRVPRWPPALCGDRTEADEHEEKGRRSCACNAAVARPPSSSTSWARHVPRDARDGTRPESAAVLRDLAASGRCEIGAHLHPWTSPPFRPEDTAGHTYPMNLPDDLLARQLRELTETLENTFGARPTTYRAGRNGLDGRSLRILEGLGYTVDTSVDPLFNERRKGGPVFAGAPLVRTSRYDDGGGRAIAHHGVPSAAQSPLPKALERLYTLLPPLPWRGALKRIGLRPVWLRPSYTSVPDMLSFGSRMKESGAPCFNVIFHSSEVLAGGSPYTPDAASVGRFQAALRALLEHLTTRLGAVGRTYAEFARDWTAA